MCDAFLFTRTQANHIRTSILAEVDNLISGIRSYRAALVAYRINLLNSLSHLSLGRLPLSLVERETLGAILTEVATGELHTPDRLTLAVPLDDLLAYYEMNLVERVYTVSEGLIIRFLVPLTSRELVLDVYEATPLPMPNPENSTYTLWKFPAPFFAVSATHKEHAILSAEQLARCLGTKQLAICHQGFPVQRNRESCLASLFYASHSAALSFCEIETKPLPTNPTATNLGFGRWLILARSVDYSLQVFNTTPSALEIPPIPGCLSCIITLACGTEVSTETLYLRADIASCANVGSRQLQLRLPAPLENLFQALPPLHEYPSIPAAQSDRLQLFREVQLGLSTLKRSELRPDIIEKIAQPLTKEHLERTKELQFVEISPVQYWKASLIVGTCSFLLSLVFLACTGGFLYWSLLRVAESVPDEENAKESTRTPRAAPTQERRPLVPYAALRQFLYHPPPPQYSAEMQQQPPRAVVQQQASRL